MDDFLIIDQEKIPNASVMEPFWGFISLIEQLRIVHIASTPSLHVGVVNFVSRVHAAFFLNVEKLYCCEDIIWEKNTGIL